MAAPAYGAVVPKTRTMTDSVLTCPLCGEAVPAAATACRGCHLPIADVRRHTISESKAGHSWTRALGVRVVGVALYAAIVAWCVWQLPASLPFVAPAAVA